MFRLHATTVSGSFVKWRWHITLLSPLFFGQRTTANDDEVDLLVGLILGHNYIMLWNFKASYVPKIVFRIISFCSPRLLESIEDLLSKDVHFWSSGMSMGCLWDILGRSLGVHLSFLKLFEAPLALQFALFEILTCFQSSQSYWPYFALPTVFEYRCNLLAHLHCWPFEIKW